MINRSGGLIVAGIAALVLTAGCSTDAGSDATTGSETDPTVATDTTESVEDSMDAVEETSEAVEDTAEATEETSEAEASAPADDSAGTEDSAATGEQSADSPLEAYAAQERAAMADMLEGDGAATYSDATVNTTEPNQIEFAYVYRDEQDKALVEDHFEANFGQLESAVVDQVIPMMQSTGVENPVVRYVYSNPDGTELWSHTFESN